MDLERFFKFSLKIIWGLSLVAHIEKINNTYCAITHKKSVNLYNLFGFLTLTFEYKMFEQIDSAYKGALNDAL